VSTGVSLKELVKPQRRCGVAVLLRNKTNPSKYMAIGALCGSWKCPTCGPYLRRKWTEHLTSRLMASGVISVLVVPDKSRWDTISKRIQRAGGQYAIIEQANGTLVALTTASEGEVVSKAVALSRLEKAVQLASDSRPVHTSRGWSLPKSAPKLGAWERVSRLHISVDDAKRITEAVGIKAETFFADYRTGFIVDLTGDWVEGDGWRYLKLLVGLDGKEGDLTNG